MKKADPLLTPGMFASSRSIRFVPFSMKMRVFKRYGIPLIKRILFTIDHLVPLELNGTNDIENLWPQPRREALIKDGEENQLAHSVVHGTMSLAAAQSVMLLHWRA